MQQRLKSHLAFIILTAILAVYLGAKTLPEESWSGWGIFAAQTMLSNDNWAKDGFFKSKFLYIPIGHSRIVKYLDEPEMRHHARGTVTGGLIGRRLYYTHYPVGYVFPYAFLRKAGVTERHWFRMLSLVFSLAALTLMYASFNLITTPGVAFFAALYYGASTMFLDFADALNNQAVDDLFRFLIMFISLFALREADDSKGSRRYDIGLWVLYFLLSVSSYDSVFFVFLWIIGLDAIRYFTSGDIRPAALVKRWFFFGTAPVAGFFIQALQNLWYLGWSDMLLDFKGAFISRTTTRDGSGGLLDHFVSMLVSFHNMTGIEAKAGVALFTVTAAGFAYLKRKAPERLPGFSHILTLLLAGAAFTFVFSYTSKYFDYQGRQWAPFAGLLIGASTVAAVRLIYLKKGGGQGALTKAVALALIPPLIFIWFMQGRRTVDFIKAWPNHAEPVEKISFYRTLKSLSPDDTVLFIIDSSFAFDYPQPSPIDEFYLGGTILYFKNFNDMVRDYRWLKGRSKDFHPLILSPDRNLLEGFATYLSIPGEIRELTDYYYVLVTG